MQSFSVQTKSELCRVTSTKPCCRVAELYGILLFSTFSNRELRITSEQRLVAQRAATLLERAFGVSVLPERQGTRWVVRVTNERALRTVFQGLGYDFKSYVVYHLNRNVVDNDCCTQAFLRGVFLVAGTIASPEKKCHLEIKTGHAALCRETMSLMLDCDLSPKMTERRTGHIIYWKDSALIEQFVAQIGAHRAMMALLEGKVERQVRGEINRQVNCETANFSRVADASARQIAAIEQALEKGGIEIFPEKFRSTIDLRVAHPTVSLAELALLSDPPLSKPGLNHRLKRIVEIAQQIIEK